MSLLEAVVVLVVGYVLGRVTLAVAGIVAILAFLLAILGFVRPDVVTTVIGDVLRAYYVGNELLFLAGFLFGVAHDRRTGSRRPA